MESSWATFLRPTLNRSKYTGYPRIGEVADELVTPFTGPELVCGLPRRAQSEILMEFMQGNPFRIFQTL